MIPRRFVRCLTMAACLTTLAQSASASGVPDGFWEILPSKGGFHMEVARLYHPPEGRGVRVNAMAIDCETLEAGKAGRPSRAKVLFTDYRVISDHDAPSDFDAAIDFFEETHKDRDYYLGRDDVAIYASQIGNEFSGVTAYSLVKRDASSVHVG